jgi:hypothetical protein
MAEDSNYIDVTYYSKSKAFLYPILQYSIDETFKAESYLFFQNHSILNGELTVVYRHGGHVLFGNFEAQKISSHGLLRGCYRAPGVSIYVYTIAAYSADIEKFLAGEYSRFSGSLKKKILLYMKDDINATAPAAGREAHAVLFPHLYRQLVADRQLFCDVRALTELAPLYDQGKETLELEGVEPCYLPARQINNE